MKKNCKEILVFPSTLLCTEFTSCPCPSETSSYNLQLLVNCRVSPTRERSPALLLPPGQAPGRLVSAAAETGCVLSGSWLGRRGKEIFLLYVIVTVLSSPKVNSLQDVFGFCISQDRLVEQSGHRVFVFCTKGGARFFELGALRGHFSTPPPPGLVVDLLSFTINPITFAKARQQEALRWWHGTGLLVNLSSLKLVRKFPQVIRVRKIRGVGGRSYSHTEPKTGFYRAKNQASTMCFKILLNFYTILFFLHLPQENWKEKRWHTTAEHRSHCPHSTYIVLTLYLHAFEAPRLQPALKVSNLCSSDS